MRNHVQAGNTLTFAAPAAAISGSVVIAGAIIGVATRSAGEGELIDVDVVGVFELPKVSALAIAVGDVVYYSPTTGLIRKTTTGDNKKIGVATSVAANPSGFVNVRLNGAF